MVLRETLVPTRLALPPELPLAAPSERRSARSQGEHDLHLLRLMVCAAGLELLWLGTLAYLLYHLMSR
ncbi:MAG TPA: hypothetical protein VKB10_09425 [Gaiellaceae bacterium]|nr:hypothetical protein [Gaiellaceae bacterium]